MNPFDPYSHPVANKKKTKAELEFDRQCGLFSSEQLNINRLLYRNVTAKKTTTDADVNKATTTRTQFATPALKSNKFALITNQVMQQLSRYVFRMAMIKGLRLGKLKQQVDNKQRSSE
ncbi:hypothetical protein T11_5209 [Trichinella zimbabwensis]|uniref:Uncharacterized protein n=1 Tax=Trichinella zimbabwensis TaxID=268475 RepID=A0A0V1I920_9BILA|nr:hypothetical protein T11_5209 [Trichinella zimbabwensis]